MKETLLSCSLLFTTLFCWCQPTVGLLSVNQDLASDGYRIIYPHNQPHVYLLDPCGAVVHRWDGDPDSRPGNTAYLLEDGQLLKTTRPATVAGNPIWAGGGGATVELRDWENNLLWSFTLNDSTARLHHDIEPMPNGNILMIAWEAISREDMIAAGRDSNLLEDVFWPDYILEVDPGLDSIVWEWHVMDHLVQDFDSTRANFGVIADHPERIDLNYDTDSDPDWMHSNAIDYHPAIDQIMLCIPYFDEIWIIDHSTTSQQAAGSVGGLSGKGGDLLWRWGNVQTYQRGVPEDQLLFFPHDAHWVLDFVEPGHPQFGQIAVFNNRIGPDFSAVNTIHPAWDMYAWTYEMSEGTWAPDNYALTLTHPQPQALYSSGLSSIQFLANDNVLICAGRNGYAIEITPDNQVVWEYKTPLRAGLPVPQGAMLEINENLTFRMDWYPEDYAAFTDRDLNDRSWIELDPDTTICMGTTSSSEYTLSRSPEVFPNPVQDWLWVDIPAHCKYLEIWDIDGSIQLQYLDPEPGLRQLPMQHLPSGIYLLQLDGHLPVKLMVHR